MVCATPPPAVLESERRFLLPLAAATDVLAAVGEHLGQEIHDPRRPVAWLRTTYLDTDDLAFLRSLDGPLARRMRLREYAAAPARHEAPVFTGLCAVEIKESAGPARRKARHLVSPPFAGWLVAAWRLRGIAPRVATWYRRTAFGDLGGRVRVTLDEDIRFHAPAAPGEAGRAARHGELLRTLPLAVLEVKLSGAEPAWLARLCGRLREARRFSKFRLAMRALRGPAVPA